MRLKSKLNCLSLGDENFRFFHLFLTAKKRKNLIRELIGDQGTPKDLILEFYRSLYSKVLGCRVIPLNLQRHSVNWHKNEFLIARFKREEIKNALNLLGRNKAPGPGSFTVEFLPELWDYFKENIKKCWRNFTQMGGSSVKENFICLIQKKEEAVCI